MSKFEKNASSFEPLRVVGTNGETSCRFNLSMMHKRFSFFWERRSTLKSPAINMRAAGFEDVARTRLSRRVGRILLGDL